MDSDGKSSILFRLARAVLLGVGAIFGLKGDSGAHWSEPPNVVISAKEEISDNSDGGPPD
jgi:hypothetical protein